MIQNYQLSDLLSETKRRLNEMVNDGLWTTAELTKAINHSLLRVALDTRIGQRDIAINITPMNSYYPLPIDTLIPQFIYGSAQSEFLNVRLFPSFLLSWDKMYGGMYQWEKDSTNTPQEYVPFSYNHFILWPAPSNADTVILHDVPQPSMLVNSTDTTTLPLVAQRLIPIHAAYIAMLKSDQQKAAGFLGEYKQRLISVRELTRHQSKVRPTQIVPAQSFDRSMANPSVRAYRNSRRYYN
jgi:hypothetical protein